LSWEKLAKYCKSNISIKTTLDYDFKASVDLGLMKVNDKGTTGLSIKGPTLTLGEISFGNKGGTHYANVYNPIYEAGMGRSIKGGLYGLKREGSSGDYKTGLTWEMKSLYLFNLDPQGYIDNISDHIQYKEDIGVGKPWSEFKIEHTPGKIKIRYGLQEDWAKSFYNILGIKGDFRYQGVTEISY
jgi:hypothetical protein